MIKRHNLNRQVETELAAALRKFEKFELKVRTNLSNDKQVNLNAFKDMGLRLATYSLAIGKGDVGRSGLISYLESGLRHFQKEFCNESTLKIAFGEEEFEFDCTKKGIGTSLFDFWNLLNVSLILRHSVFQKELLDLSEKCLSQKGDPFWRRSVGLTLMCLEEKEFEPSILTNIKDIVKSGIVMFHGIDGKGLVKSDKSRKLRELLWLPLMGLYYDAHEGKQEQFNASLRVFLQSKKDWIIENKEEDNSSYWIDFPLLGCCSYAHDRGISIDVVSEYVPDFVYRGDF